MGGELTFPDGAYMKKQTQYILLVASFMTALFWGLPKTTLAGALVRDGKCTIDTDQDFEGSVAGKGPTLRLAVKMINAGTVPNQRQCKQGIQINDSVIHFTRPMYFEIPAEQATAGSPYVIEGMNSAAPVLFDFSAVALPSGDPKNVCVITIKNTNNLILRNVKISGAKTSGICIGSLADNLPVTNVKFDNVRVENAAGHGFIFRNMAKDNLLMSNSSVSQVGGDGVQILGSGLQNFNQIQATNKIVQKDAYGNELGDLNTGLALFDDLATGTAEQNFELFSIGSESLINTVGAAHVRIDDVRQVNTTDNSLAWQVKGRVVQLADGDTKGCAVEVKSAIGVQRIQIYVDDPGQGRAQFLTYVVRMGSNQYGVNTQGNIGFFTFVLKPSDFGREQIGLIALVPELSTNNIGGSSRLVTLANGTAGDCAGVGSGPDGGNGGIGTVNSSKFYTRDRCLDSRGRDGSGLPIPGATVTIDPTVDSDGDGIPDVIEDSDGDCNFTKNDISSWQSADSDGDGIPDLEELNGASLRSIKILSQGQQRSTISFCGDNATDNATKDLCDVNGDKVSNAQDKDSDGDGIPDYEEDRSPLFQISNIGHFYYYLGAVKSPVPGANNAKISCNFSNYTTRATGAEYGLYIITRGADGTVSGTPLAWHYDRMPQSNQEIHVLVCVNDTIDAQYNFNGRQDSQGETNPYNVDTDNDGICDGRGLKCADSSKVNDTCPTDRDTSCTFQCNDMQSLRYVDAIYREDGAGLKVENGYIKLFEENKANPDVIRTLCGGQNSDRDGDGIPDCVELPSGQCTDLFSSNHAQGSSLNPYLKDTDGDGAEDSIDLNPFKFNASGLTSVDDSGMTDTQRNALRSVFLNNPYLMLFVDRDSDGLKDGEEDLNLNSRPDTIGGIEAKATTETDPLKKDTDGDLIEDIIEVQKWGRYTNPADADTDDDGLIDSLEVQNWASTPNKPYSDQSGRGCATFIKIQPSQTVTSGSQTSPAQELLRLAKTETNRIGTDPSKKDTDGDGIDDGVEVTGSFNGELTPDQIANFPLTGIDMVSNPLAKDSDGDSVNDDKEYGTSGIMDQNGSNPCAKDTDHDTIRDDREVAGCAMNSSPTCVGPATNGGVDNDGDGLSDTCEVQLGTDSKTKDSDGDGLLDGVEDLNKNCQRDPGETDALNPDSDGDHLSDGIEKQLLTDALKADSDGDCISDDKELGLTDAASLSAAMNTVTIHMANGQTKTAQVVLQRSYSAGANTNPMSADTDGDGLCDGGNPVPRADGTMLCIRGEDLSCNGILDKDAKNPNIILETDPRNPDTDSDGANDKQEMCAGGTCNLAANIGNATTGRSTGCFSLTGNDPLDPASMLYVFGALIMLNRMFRLSLRKREE